MRLASATSPELCGRDDLQLLIPLGATEQHGPHLPLETDSLIARRVAELVALDRSDVVVAPALHYGSSGEHAGFPGTLSIGQAVLEDAVVELVRSADWCRRVVLIAWHGGNAEPLARALTRLRAEGRRVEVWQLRSDSADAHAGRAETSLLLALAPSLVRPERPVGATEPLPALMPALRADGVLAVAPNGVLGDARGASAHEGRQLLSQCVAEINALLDDESGR